MLKNIWKDLLTGMNFIMTINLAVETRYSLEGFK